MDTTDRAQWNVDLLVIGWGKGGKTLAQDRGRAGDRVVMVEQSAEMYGGACINVACVPTKALVHHATTRRPEDDAPTWYADAIGAVQHLTAAMRAKNHAMLDTLDTVTIVTGRARFVGPRTVEVRAGADVLRITAETVVINTGSVPVIPPIDGVRESRFVLTNPELLSAAELPRRFAVIGGGPVGLEFAAAYRRLGAEVTVLEGGSFLPAEDERVRDAVVELLEADGVAMVAGAKVTAIADLDGTPGGTEGDRERGGTGGDHEPNGTGGARVSYVVDGEERHLEADLVLLATGRRPATDGLGLEAAGIAVGERGEVVVDEHLETNVPRVYAVGDANGGPQFTYISLDDYRVVASHRYGDGARSVADRVAVANATFVTPPLARVGLTERAARAAGHDVVVADKDVADMAMMPRPKIEQDPRGFWRIVVDRDSRRVLGAAILCVGAHEVINTIALAMRHGVTADELRDGIWIHPSVTEGLNDVLKGI